MLTVSYKVTGVDGVIRDLQKLNVQALEPTVGDILEEIGQDAADYPPPPAGSTYERTEALKRGWLDSEPTFTETGQTLIGILTNSTPYGPFVQGIEDQAAIHADRWRTTGAIMDAWETRAAQRIEDALGRLVSA
jgi:hypothetical protein